MLLPSPVYADPGVQTRSQRNHLSCRRYAKAYCQPVTIWCLTRDVRTLQGERLVTSTRIGAARLNIIFHCRSHRPHLARVSMPADLPAEKDAELFLKLLADSRSLSWALRP